MQTVSVSRFQVEQRAMEVWGSEEELEKQRELRDEKRVLAKSKKYNKNMKGKMVILNFPSQ